MKWKENGLKCRPVADSRQRPHFLGNIDKLMDGKKGASNGDKIKNRNRNRAGSGERRFFLLPVSVSVFLVICGIDFGHSA